MRFLWLSAALAILGQQPAPDPFVAQHDAVVARYPFSRNFTIAIAGVRSTFRIGEPIPLALIYYNGAGRRGLAGKPLRRSATAVLDHADGAADPGVDWVRSLFLFPSEGECRGVESGLIGGVMGGVTGGESSGSYRYDETLAAVVFVPSPPPLPPPPPPPFVLHVLLDGVVRFDAPGHYRLYLEDHYDLNADQRPPDLAHPGRRPFVSNIIDLDITRDERWERETIDAAIRVLETSASRPVRVEAATTLARFDSPRAVDEITRLFVREGTVDAFALFAARDRDRVIATLDAIVADPREPVTGHHLKTLAVLRLTREDPGFAGRADRRAVLVEVQTRRMRALARAGLLVSGLTSAFQSLADPCANPDPLTEVVTSGALAAFPAETASALTQVSAAVRERVLDGRWPAFTDSRLVPLLDRLARGGSEAALRILNDVAPGRARPLIVRDLASARPRLPLSIAGALPDETLPELDGAFLRQLETAPNPRRFRDALARIARCASASIAGRVERAYAARRTSPSCERAAAALSYLFRVAPARGRALLEAIRQMPVPPSDDCDGTAASALEGAAALRWSPGLQAVLEEHLEGSDARAAVLAAVTMSRYGPAQGKDTLMRALDGWRRRWSPAQIFALDRTDTWEAALEARLMEAIADGAAWRFLDEDLAHLKAGCKLYTCKGQIDDAWLRNGRQPPAEPHLEASYDFKSKEFWYYVDGVQVTSRQLDARMALYPRGTSLHWDGSSFADRWGDRQHARVEAIAARHGLTLHRSTTAW